MHWGEKVIKDEVGSYKDSKRYNIPLNSDPPHIFICPTLWNLSKIIRLINKKRWESCYENNGYIDLSFNIVLFSIFYR